MTTSGKQHEQSRVGGASVTATPPIDPTPNMGRSNNTPFCDDPLQDSFTATDSFTVPQNNMSTSQQDFGANQTASSASFLSDWSSFENDVGGGATGQIVGVAQGGNGGGAVMESPWGDLPPLDFSCLQGEGMDSLSPLSPSAFDANFDFAFSPQSSMMSSADTPNTFDAFNTNWGLEPLPPPVPLQKSVSVPASSPQPPASNLSPMPLSTQPQADNVLEANWEPFAAPLISPPPSNACQSLKSGGSAVEQTEVEHSRLVPLISSATNSTIASQGRSSNPFASADDMIPVGNLTQNNATSNSYHGDDKTRLETNTRTVNAEFFGDAWGSNTGQESPVLSEAITYID